MSNKHLTDPPSDVALERLKVLLEATNNAYQNDGMVLERDIVNSYHEALNLFFESLDGSILKSVMNIYPGTPADPDIYNMFSSALSKDIRAIFVELGALDNLIASSFNSIVSEREQALEISKRIGNKIGDFQLYADPKLGAGFFFGDSFNTADRVEVGSSLNDSDECFLSTEEGVVLLPLDGTPQVPSVKEVIVNKQSNGTPGSNYQLDVFGHSDLEVISDSEPNTWFEYEKVATKESNIPLVLDLTIVLQDISIINHININPINFGTPSPVYIVKLETSKDGKDYVSIADEVPLKDFASEQEDNEFVLSPSTSKGSGQGFYSFLPRKVQYVHVVFQQHTPYAIDTNSGTLLRYAIGIRDINLLGRKFLLEGSLVSTPFTSAKEIKKVSIWASENPVEESELADVKHFVSSDDGSSWLGIQPQERDGYDIPEILNFNNSAEDSVSTEEEVKTLRHKITMKRNKDSFTGNVTLKQERLPKMDIVSTPGGGQFDVNTTEKPVSKSVNVIFPFMGSFSCPRPRNGSSVVSQSTMMDLDFVEFTVNAPGERIKLDDTKEGSFRLKLPYKGIPNLEEKIRVFINGEQIEYASKSDTTLTGDSKVYFLNKKGIELQFGHTNALGVQAGYVPLGGSKVQVCLDGDNPFLRLTDRGYILNLTVPSDGQKETISLVALESLSTKEAESFQIEIPSGTSKFKAVLNLEPVIKLSNKESKSISATKLITNAAKLGNSLVGKVSIASTSKIAKSPLGGPWGSKMPIEDREKTAFKKGLTQTSFFGSSTRNVKSRAEIIVTEDMLSEIGHWNEDTVGFDGSFFLEGNDGLFPPVYAEGIANFDMIEYDLAGVVHTSPQFTTKVAFVDGDSELRDSSGYKVTTSYTFDPYSGTVYLGSAPGSSRKAILVCKKHKLKIISQDFWDFDKNLVTGKINTKKIVLDPRVVLTVPRTYAFAPGVSDARSISLTEGNVNSHEWFNSKLVRGTIKIGEELFNGKAIEIPFQNGEKEFSNIVQVQDESIIFDSTNIPNHTYQLDNIDPVLFKTLHGVPTFASVRSISSATTGVSQFDLTPTATPISDGQWNVSSTGLVTLCLATVPNTHSVSYQINNTDSGINLLRTYSIDYNNGVLHAGSILSNQATISFELSLYSAFYNIAEQVEDTDIEKIDVDTKTITFGSAFGMRFLKQDLVSSSRPQVLKIFYDYYLRASESFKDLEPYFSPICKDIAFRSITADQLEEL